MTNIFNVLLQFLRFYDKKGVTISWFVHHCIFKYCIYYRGEKHIIFSFHILFIFSNVVTCFKNISPIFLTEILFWFVFTTTSSGNRISYSFHFSFSTTCCIFHNQSVCYKKDPKIRNSLTIFLYVTRLSKV